MAHHFRESERRQKLLLPADMMEWLPDGDIAHLIVDAVALMDLSQFEAGYKIGRAGQAPFVLLGLLIYAYSHGVRSSRVIERLCWRDAGYRFIVGDAVPDHTVIRPRWSAWTCATAGISNRSRCTSGHCSRYAAIMRASVPVITSSDAANRSRPRLP